MAQHDDEQTRLQHLAEDLLRRVAEADVDADEARARHAAELTTRPPAVSAADRSWFGAPPLARAIVYVVLFVGALYMT